MRVLVSVLLVFLVVVTGQKGNECSQDEDCEEHQSCGFGYCKCSLGFVKIKNSCHQDGLQHGEKCEDDVQCSSDHRLGCKEFKNGYKICQCNKHYDYDEDLEECVNARNMTELLHLMQEQWKSYDKLESEAKKVFVGLVTAGLLSIILGIMFAGGCIVYGCCIPRWKMARIPEEDFQTMPLCQVTREDAVPATSGEPITPAGTQPSPWDDPTDPGNISSHIDDIV
ncbi:uncharacterized protein [Hetaerina americana]|uniref:uncharacterized protein n=1 Tax=Hetaerina americana TaxID=62018 RepID=UPI003A7F1C54